jgi:hypothetical protein
MTAAALGAGGRRPGRLRWLPLLLGGLVVEVILAMALATRPSMVIAAVVGLTAIGIAIVRVDLLVIPVLATLPLVPVYAAPRYGYVELEATTCGLWLVAAGITARSALLGGKLRMTATDYAFLLFLGLLLVPVLTGLHHRADFIGAAWTAVGPYLGMRLYMARRPDANWLASVFVGLALLTVPFILIEVATGNNVFFGLSLNASESALWATSQERAGSLRAEGAFGHSIALAMFLATGFLLALTRLLLAPAGSRRWFWGGSALLLLPMMLLTGSRTGFVVVVVGIILLVIAAPLQLTRARLISIIVTGIVALTALTAVVPSDVPSPTRLIGSSGSEVGQSSRYRQQLLDFALSGEALHPWSSGQNLAVSALGSSNTSIDNEYLLLASEWGLVPLGGFLLIVVTLVVALVRLRDEGTAWALPAVTLANFAGLFFVAMITQQEIYIWALVGACAGLTAARRARGPRSLY